MDQMKQRKVERKFDLLGPAWPEDGEMEDENKLKYGNSPIEGKSYKDNLTAQLQNDNLAETLDEQTLEEISQRCKGGFTIDLTSREDWEDCIDEWTELAMQVRRQKSFPWPNASNVKYPLLSTAAMQFAARAYPSLLPSDGKIAKCITIGKDPTGEKADKAERLSLFMSWQVMDDMDGWEEDMDKMMMMLPVVGTMFKKTYFDSSEQKICSHLVMPKDLIINYWAKDMDCAERVSERIYMSARIVEERKRQGIFLNRDLHAPVKPDTAGSTQNNTSNDQAKIDETTPYELIEQHTFLDLDDDGYEEPYVVTFERDSGTILRIVARYEADGIEEYDGKIIKIRPTQYYTKYGFVPNPDGSFYSIGFGVLLGPINEAVNTLINQLIDAGTQNNLNAGFIGKGLRIKMGEARFQPGEWKPVNATGDDLRKQIVPLPSKEPSNVLFQLMGSLITSGKELASVAEIFVGKMPGQNTPATTTMASIEQGMKVFTAVYKRIYRSLGSEFKKIFDLNKVYLDPNTYASVLDEPVGPDDFDDSQFDVVPGADPTAVSQTEKLLKAQGLMELMAQAPSLMNPVEVLKRILQAQEQPNWEQVLAPQVVQTGQAPPPPPDPKMMEMQMKSQAEQQKAQLNAQQADHKAELDSRSQETQLAMKSQEHQMDMEAKAQKIQLDAVEALHKQRLFEAEAQQKAVQSHQEHQQNLHQQKQAGDAKVEVMRKQAAAKPKPTSKK